MRYRSVFVVALLSLFAAIGASAQTSAEIDQRYGTRKFYQVRPLSLMLPIYDAHGQICRAEIFPNHQPSWENLEDIKDWPQPMPVSGDLQVSGAYQLDVAELWSIFDELAPVSMRQGKGKASLDMQGFGGAYWTNLKFDNVVFRVEVGIRCGSRRLDMSAAEDNMENFLRPPFGEIIGARIEWPGRVCIEPADVDPGDIDLTGP